MNALRRVLAGIDFSARADRVAHRAALISKETGAGLDLFHAVNLSSLHSFRQLVPRILEGLEQRAVNTQREQLAILSRELDERHKIVAGVSVATGDAFTQIEIRADEVSADLVILGSHGISAWPFPIVGSTVARMAAASRHSVLVVKEKPSGPYRNLLLPVDFSAQSGLALSAASAVAPEGNLILMHAYGVPFEGKLRASRDLDAILEPFLATAQREAYQKMRKLLDTARVAGQVSELVVVHGEALPQILELEKTRRCDLIIIGRRGTVPLLEQVFLGSVAKQVLALSRADVLIVR
ncbi:universal stress protein [Arthrobacter flavus]|uniref:Universal stress protein n=1 Tax=Arthrobacter flavus TaxID=95172 RepID=A0ABW4Q4P2_9MICC